ncbi:succinic semialdehyde dehydrogenase [Hortaea werneckii]|uniref:Succinate-semialdehyde dehydrogenase, mitochondrial n=1 Tax=Hortaea werneckii TaxID=91943 RepID=A0A3M7DDH6_HORWE|nr:succinic semialdehyde dehydrogenase [Hortaea werneckii]KAI7722854.1 succinic semialdehyde dehydrogenase [Hortaea werneckii]RMY62282.1 hypothetical protein D0865_00532 [Hortaea werneckii]
MDSLRCLADPTIFRDKNYIGGRWTEAASGKKFSVSDPATSTILGSCPESGEDDVRKAVESARDALPAWRSQTGRARSRILRRWYELVHENRDDLARLIWLENGKTRSDAYGEVDFANSFLEWYSEEAARIYGDVIPHSSSGFQVSAIKEPVGVCAMLVPWNFPAAMVTRKLGPALAAGCTVVIKTAGETPFTANAIIVLAERAGVPKGAINVVTALDNTPLVGKALCQSDIVRKVSFTGSTRVGKLLMEQSASTLKKLSLELGGNAPFIVFNDADIDVAVQAAVASKFKSSGQTCVCANRLMVQSKIYPEFIRRLKCAVSKLSVGLPGEDGTTMGPLISAAAADRMKLLVDESVHEGAEIELGGHKRDEVGPAFFAPTILSNVHKNMRICKEEIFGPIAPVSRFDTEEEAINAANDCDMGLASYLYTTSLNRSARCSTALQSGMVAINTGVISNAAAPFGGIKHSGIGREGGRYGLEEYLQIKTIVTGDTLADHRARL